MRKLLSTLALLLSLFPLSAFADSDITYTFSSEPAGNSWPQWGDDQWCADSCTDYGMGGTGLYGQTINSSGYGSLLIETGETNPLNNIWIAYWNNTYSFNGRYQPSEVDMTFSTIGGESADAFFQDGTNSCETGAYTTASDELIGLAMRDPYGFYIVVGSLNVLDQSYSNTGGTGSNAALYLAILGRKLNTDHYQVLSKTYLTNANNFVYDSTPSWYIEGDISGGMSETITGKFGPSGGPYQTVTATVTGTDYLAGSSAGVGMFTDAGYGCGTGRTSRTMLISSYHAHLITFADNGGRYK